MKVNCDKCGVKILPTTYKKNDGLCMPCNGGYRDRIIEMAEADDEDTDEKPIRLYVKLTGQLLKLHKSEIQSNIQQVEECIHSLEKAFETLNSRKKWWSRFRLDKGVNWLEGAGIANCAAEVTNKIQNTDLELEDRSTKIWVGTTLAVCSHYHHMVGPAMIASAKIAERKGDSIRVRLVCEAVIQDFEVILERTENLKQKPVKDGDDYTSLKSLEYAVHKYIEIGAASEETFNMKKRLKQALEVHSNNGEH